MAIKVLKGEVSVIKDNKTHRISGVKYKNKTYLPKSTFTKNTKLNTQKVRIKGKKTVYVTPSRR